MVTARFAARSVLVVALVANSSVSVLADEEEGFGSQKWVELELRLPLPPRESELLPIYVSAATDNRFFVDPVSLVVGEDEVVRYTLVVMTSGGAKNVSFEGMRCQTKEKRLYAFGRSDGTWSKARSDRWEPIREAAANRVHATLFQEYFCPGGVIVRSVGEAKDALLRGGNPSVVAK